MRKSLPYEGVPGDYRVTFTFRLYGMIGQESYPVTVVNHASPYAVAWGPFESDLIDIGLETWECGCCVCDKNIKVLRHDVTPLLNPSD